MSGFLYDHGERKHTLDGFPIPSVTQILGGGYPKPALVGWAAKETAEEAYELREALPKMGHEHAVDLLKGARWRRLNKAASRGTSVHNAIAAHFAGDDTGELTDEQWGYFNAALRFFDEHAVECVESEFSIYSRTHGYCGRVDFKGRRNGGPLEVIDFKTKAKKSGDNPRLYGEVVLQLTAYDRAEYLVRDDGEELELEPVGAGVGVMLLSDGEYRAWPIALDDDAFDAFLATRTLWEFDARGGYRRRFGRLLKPAA
jgi:hypothetical protein